MNLRSNKQIRITTRNAIKSETNLVRKKLILDHDRKFL
jgi:hypothetical protein